MVATDYVGLGTPGLMSYLNSVATAHAVVDSVIAAHQMGLPLSQKWAIVGQSQGGGAAVNSARWATEFSVGSGLDYRGVVATGTPANIESVHQDGWSQTSNFPRRWGLPPIATPPTSWRASAKRGPTSTSTACSVQPGVNAVDQAETLCKPQLDEHWPV